MWGISNLKDLIHKKREQIDSNQVPEETLWFVKNQRFTPRQGRLLIVSIIGLHVVLSISLSFIIQGKLNTFTIMLLSLLILFGIFGGLKEIYHWFPIYLFLAIYDMLSIIQKAIQITHFDKIFYDFDLYCFGWLFHNTPPSYYFYEHHLAILDIFFGVFYVIHIIFPPIIILYLRVKYEDKFDRMAWSALFLIIICIAFFIFMPTAPPWYSYYYGFNTDGVSKITMKQATAGLWYTDKDMDTDIFSLIMWKLTSAKFASFPSMHVGAPSYIYFSTKYAKISKLSKIMLVYVIIIFSAVIYLNHHWVADALGGLIFAWFASWLSYKIYGNNYNIGAKKIKE